MRTTPSFFAAICALMVAVGGASAAPVAPARPKPVPTVTKPRIQVLFSPGGGCTEAIVDALGRAKSTIDVQAYSFTSAPIAQAIAQAKDRGVKIRVVLDRSQRTERYTSATYLLHHDVPTWIDSEHAIAHNKIIVIDRSIIFTGSFNFTKSAEQKNTENLLIIEGHPELVAAYEANFEEHLGHSEKYEAPAAAADKDTVTPPTESEQTPNKPAARRPRKAA